MNKCGVIDNNEPVSEVDDFNNINDDDIEEERIIILMNIIKKVFLNIIINSLFVFIIYI